MIKNDIKKYLYKQNPNANFSYIRKGVAFYKTVINTEKVEEELSVSYQVFFEIPVIDMGDADFYKEMESKYLIRWIVSND